MPTDRFDARTERELKTLLPWVRVRAREFLAACRAARLDIRIVSGSRTFAQQSALYAQGRTRPGKRVTNGRAGYSEHNFRVAFDIGVFHGDIYLPESPLYARAGKIAKQHGLFWGGDWQNFPDPPHFSGTNAPIWRLREWAKSGVPIPKPTAPLNK